MISYLTAPPRPDFVAVGHHEFAKLWWDAELSRNRGYVSELVVLELKSCDVDVTSRVERAKSLPLLDAVGAVDDLSNAYRQALDLSPAFELEACHLALAALHGVDFFVTWDLKHIASNPMRRIVDRVNAVCGIQSPVICTPWGSFEGSVTLLSDESIDPIVAELRRARQRVLADSRSSGLSLLDYIRETQVRRQGWIVRRAPRVAETGYR